MVSKIDFFDMNNVGPEAKRLAFCFNLSARVPPPGDSPLAHAERLFRETTGSTAFLSSIATNRITCA